jgi:hypothetical protein
VIAGIITLILILQTSGSPCATPHPAPAVLHGTAREFRGAARGLSRHAGLAHRMLPLRRGRSAGARPLWVPAARFEVPGLLSPGAGPRAQLIGELGLEDFYRFRTAPRRSPAPPSSESWSSYDEPALSRR